MNEENSDTPIENEEAKSPLSGEESIAKNQPLSNDNLPSQTIHYTEKPKSTFEKTLGVLNVLFTGLMVFVTLLLVRWASKQWEVMKGQWQAMNTSIELTKEMNRETKSLAEETIKYAKEQTEASRLLAEAARRSADATMRTAQLAEKSLKIHIDPEISCFLEEHPIYKGFLLFTVKNIGQLNAASVSVNHNYFRYDKPRKKIQLSSAGGDSYNEPGIRWMYWPLLTINQSESKLTGEEERAPGGEYIDCLFYEIEYFRDSDGRKYTKRCEYYVDGKNIYTAAEFQRNEYYQSVQSELADFMRMNIHYPSYGHKQ